MEHTYENCHNLTCRRKERDFGYNQALEDFANVLIDNLVDFGEGQNVIMAIDRGRIVRLAKQLVK